MIKKTADSMSEMPLPTSNSIDVRLMRTMAGAVALAAIISVPFATWRVTTGLLLGGLLSLLNLHWMRSSISAAFDMALGRGTKPRITVAHFVLRYLVVFAAVLTAYKLQIVSLSATIVGLCSFVIALFVEALREFYFVIIHREETR